MRIGRGKDRGFSLVELMIVVAIIGILATLGITGVRHYLGFTKSSEGKLMVGTIARDAVAAYNRGMMAAENINEGDESAQFAHLLCGSAIAVPATVPAAKKYQPSTADGSDFQTGDVNNGWTCLRFRLNQPIYYQYHYVKDGGPVAAGSPVACSANCFEASAIGDLDDDGLLGRFAITGHLNLSTGQMKQTSLIWVENETE